MSVASYDFRPLTTIEDLEDVVKLEIQVWQLDPKDAVPASLMHAIVHAGGLVVGAYDKTRLIGMALAFLAYRADKTILWSHMAAVHPDFQGQGIGFKLKQYQRTWALERGFRIIAWTFDPLQAGNANFNLHYLGATSDTYHVNFYGEMMDGINVGLPSDRLEVIWDLKSQRVKNLSSGKRESSTTLEGPSALVLDERQKPVVNLAVLNENSTYLCVEIPFDLSSLKRDNPDIALHWRLCLREVFQIAIANGYTIENFLVVGGRSYYVLKSSEFWYLYVVRCNDDTLYTGITPNVAKRIATHNAGRGAAYTRHRRPVELIGIWRFRSRSLALKAERLFKRLSRIDKLRLLDARSEFSDAPFVFFE